MSLYSRNYYKIAIIIVCLNSIFELVFQYRFQADIKMEEIYFLIWGIVSIVAIKNMVIKKQEKPLPVIIVFGQLSCYLFILSAHVKFLFYRFYFHHLSSFSGESINKDC